MANNYFRFKQFTINQYDCAMKVTTDACLFGAWVAEKISSRNIFSGHIFQILDIGTGTGLLAMMLAQKMENARIDAVEIDGNAAKQAKENFDATAWKDRLQVFHTSIQTFDRPDSGGYDLIISNPPFFDNDLKSFSKTRNVAMHSDALSFDELFINVKRLLSDNGEFAVLLPYHRTGYFEKMAITEGFGLLEKNMAKQTQNHPFFRGMLLFGHKKNGNIPVEGATSIKENNDYSPRFKYLLKDYYLHL